MPIMPANISESIDITENGSHNVAKYTTANVSVDPVVESLNVTPTISAQSLTPTTGVDGFNEVNVLFSTYPLSVTKIAVKELSLI